jgi:hypothetical protein
MIFCHNKVNEKRMRLTFYILTFFLGIMIVSFKVRTNPIKVTGHLKSNPKDTYSNIGGMTIILKGDNKILTQTITDKKGDFELTFTPNTEKSFNFFCYGLGVDTLLVESVKTFESDNPEMNFYIPANRKKNSRGNTICPICNKADKILIIDYGMFASKYSKKEKKFITEVSKGHINAGTCIVGIASFFCERDKVKF